MHFECNFSSFRIQTQTQSHPWECVLLIGSLEKQSRVRTDLHQKNGVYSTAKTILPEDVVYVVILPCVAAWWNCSS